MKSDIQSLEGLKRELSVEVPVEEVKTAYDKRLKAVAKEAKIDGFRAGKVPVNVVEQRFGKGVMDEVAGQIIQKNFDQAVKDADTRVAGTPSITEYSAKKGEPLTFKATFEVYPEIELNSLDGVTIEKELATVSDADLMAMLEKIQRQHAEYELVEDRAAKDGDRVVIDFDGSIDGEQFEGGAAKEHTLELGSKSMIPGFESGIEGMFIADHKDVNVTFPEDYQADDLKGKEAVFKITLHKIEAPKLPPADDALAEKMKVEGGIEGLKAKMKEGMERELNNQLKNRLKEAVMDKLIEANDIEVPAPLVTAEIQHLKKMSMDRMASQYGMQPEQLGKLSLPDDMFKDQADKRVRLGLLLSEVIKKYEIKSTKEKLDKKVKEAAAYYQKPEEVEQWYLSNQQALSELEAGLIEDEAVEKLLSEASVTDKNVNYEDVVQ